jgi:hypothetical protein
MQSYPQNMSQKGTLCGLHFTIRIAPIFPHIRRTELLKQHYKSPRASLWKTKTITPLRNSYIKVCRLTTYKTQGFSKAPFRDSGFPCADVRTRARREHLLSKTTVRIPPRVQTVNPEHTSIQ